MLLGGGLYAGTLFAGKIFGNYEETAITIPAVSNSGGGGGELSRSLLRHRRTARDLQAAVQRDDQDFLDMLPAIMKAIEWDL